MIAKCLQSAQTTFQAILYDIIFHIDLELINEDYLISSTKKVSAIHKKIGRKFLTLRTCNKRLTKKTICFSKSEWHMSTYVSIEPIFISAKVMVSVKAMRKN